MKKIFLFILIIVSIDGFAQFPNSQGFGTANTVTNFNGAGRAHRGLINGVFTDTTTANADHIDFYNGAQIYTRSDRNFWLRDSVLNMWIRMAKYSEVSAGSQTLQQVFDTEVGGSVLTKPDSIIAGTHTLKILTLSSAVNPFLVKATTGQAILGQATTGFGIYGLATGAGGTGVIGNTTGTSSTNTGIYGLAEGSLATTNRGGVFEAMNATNNYAIIVPSGSGRVGFGTGSPNASSILDLTSTTQGLLVPRMTEAQRDAIGTPATGLLIYQTDGTAGFYYYDGAVWTAVGGGGGSDTHFGANNLTQTGARTYAGGGFDYTFNNLGTWTKNFGSSQVLNQADYFKQSVIVGNAEGLFETFIDDAGGDQIILRLTTDNIRNTLTWDEANGFHLESQNPATPGILSRIVMFPDSIQFQPSLGILNIDSLRTQYGDTTTWKPLVWSPDNKGVKKFNSWGEIGLGGGGSGTVNTGASLKAAYYPSAGTTVDDVTGVEFNNTNLLSKFTAQASTDVIMELRMAASQTADPLVIKNSSGSNMFQFQKAGHFLLTSDGTATLQNPDGFDNVLMSYGGNNSRWLVASGSGYDHRLVAVSGPLSGVYTNFVDGGGVGMETNNALNFITNKIARATISAGGVFTLNGRFVQKQGADVASAVGAIALGVDGDAFEITGTSAITLISNVSFQNGAVVTLLFTSTASLTDGTANSGTDIGMELAGNTNFTGSTGATVTLRLMELGGTQRWYEISRSVQ